MKVTSSDSDEFESFLNELENETSDWENRTIEYTCVFCDVTKTKTKAWKLKMCPVCLAHFRYASVCSHYGITYGEPWRGPWVDTKSLK